ncbi:helix-turn-helix domain-containing protein [Collimonas sp.]|jgi:DNA-binding HxlR family transcriptional regulator|uniref:winged helix-turn-helix transcriptional regulator n=1 Tax=Collimonas sp. TaxID=1963772 RepID=UPI002B9C9585|nr:helix-turn-helix domain-containing protein [Collimonas sp.]HWX03468.1 helix-turn-helix domain-containing protein [Collimonas sp.]
MAKRKSLKGDSCPVARALDVVGDRWSLLIIRDTFDGMRRFGEFQKSLGVARNILADRLQTLVAEGILEAAPASDGSAYQEYLLTAKGEGLFMVVVGLRQWGEKHLFGNGEAHSRMVESASGKPILKMELRSRDGHLLGPSDTLVRKVGSATAG